MDMKKREAAIQSLEQIFGDQWQRAIAELGTEDLRRRVGKELTSFMAFSERGQGGDSK